MKLIHLLMSLVLVIPISLSCKKGDSATSVSPGPTPDPTPTNPTNNEKNDVVFITGNAFNSGNVYALNAKDGSIKWSTSLYANTSGYWGINSSPTLVNGTLYLGCPPNRVVALDALTGTIKWNCILQSGSANYLVSSPLVVNNSLFIGQGTKFYCIDITTGTFKWIYTQAGISIPNDLEFSSPCYYNNTVYLNAASTGLFDGIYGLDMVAGTVQLSAYIPSQKYGTSVSPCMSNDTIYSVFSNNSYGTGSVYRLKVSNYAAVPGNFSIPQTEQSSSPTIFNGKLFIGSANSLYAYDISPGASSPLKWQFQGTSQMGHSSPTADSNTVYIGSEDKILYAVNSSNGTKKWEFQAPIGQIYGPPTSPTLANNVVYFGTPTGMYAVKADTGVELWRNTTVVSVYSSPVVISKTGEIFHSSASGIKN